MGGRKGGGIGSQRQSTPYIGTEKQPLCTHGSSCSKTYSVLVRPRRLLDTKCIRIALLVHPSDTVHPIYSELS